MMLRSKQKLVVFFVCCFTVVAAQAQNARVVLADSLFGRTLGSRTGGVFVSDGGWQVTDADNMIVYDLGEYLENGSVEIEVRNFNPKIQNTARRQHFLAMFRNPWGTHHPAEELETVWDLHAGERYAPGIKVLSWTYQENESISELFEPVWNAAETYRLRITWFGTQLNYYRDDVLLATHQHSAPMQLRYLFVGRDFTVSGDLITNYQHNQYPALVGPIYSNLVVKQFADSADATPPEVRDILTSEVYANAARIRWSTDESSACRVEYGIAGNYDKATAVLGPPAKMHEAVLPDLLPQQAYSYRIVAGDRHHKVTVSPELSFTTLARGSYLFQPVADAFVEADGVYAPTRSHGNFGWMHLLLSTGRESYLQFRVNEMNEKITGATLRLHGRQSGSGASVEVLASDWSEMDVTWRNKPARRGIRLGTIPSIEANEWSEVSVLPAMGGKEVYNFALIGSSAPTASIDSRESTNFRPELILTTSEDSTRQQSALRFTITDATILRPGSSNSWDANIRERGWFLYDNGRYHAWYGGWRGDYNHDIPNLVKLGYATSTDGVNWTKHPNNPIYHETWIEDMCVVKHDSMFYMYAEDEYTGGGDNVHIILYTSEDGINWKKQGTVLEKRGDGWESLEVATPTVWKENDVWYMLYEGIGKRTAGQIGLATSPDGITWTRYQYNPVLANPYGKDRDIAIDSIIKLDGVYYAYGHYRDRRQRWVGGVFTSCDLISWTLRSNGEIPHSSSVVVDTGDDFLLYGVDFDGRAPFRIAHAEPKTAADAELNCLPKENYSLRYDGVDDQVEIKDSDLLSGGIGKSITVEAWIKPDSLAGTRPIIQKFLSNVSKDWGLQIKDGSLEVAIENSGDNWVLQAGTIVPDTWTHVAFTFDNSRDIVRLLINGVEVGSKTLKKNMPNTKAAIRLGYPAYSGLGFAGEIDEVRIWNVARSSEDIAALMSVQLTGNEGGLIGYWPMNEGNGQNLGDVTSGGNDGSLGRDDHAEDEADPAWVPSTAPISAFLEFDKRDDGDVRNREFVRAPGNYALYQNYPNPFNPETSISYDLREPSTVRLSIHDVLGREVATLLEGEQPAGHYKVPWNGRDAAGRVVSSGVYFYRLQANAFSAVRKMSLLR